MMIGMASLQIMEEEARRARGRADDAWIGQYHLGSEMALELIELARCEVMRRAQAHRDARAGQKEQNSSPRLQAESYPAGALRWGLGVMGTLPLQRVLMGTEMELFGIPVETTEEWVLRSGTKKHFKRGVVIRQGRDDPRLVAVRWCGTRVSILMHPNWLKRTEPPTEAQKQMIKRLQKRRLSGARIR